MKCQKFCRIIYHFFVSKEKLKKDEFKKCRKNPVYFIEKYFNVNSVPLELFSSQKQIIEDLQDYPNNVFKKRRQIGMSFVLIAYSLWRNIFAIKSNKILFVATNIEVAKNLSRLYAEMYQNILIDFKMNKIEWTKLEKKHTSLYNKTVLVQFTSCSNSKFFDSNYDLIIYDEFASMNQTSVMNSNKIVISSTPNQLNSSFDYYYKHQIRVANGYAWNKSSFEKKDELKDIIEWDEKIVDID